MRSVTFFFLLCSSLLSFSQKEFSTASHPFQVLFVESASYIGKEGEVEQFDFISEYDLLKNKGNLVLLHFSGLVVETNERILNINQGWDTLKYSKHLDRVIISKTPQEVGYAGTDNSMEVEASCGRGHFDIIYPFFCKLHNIRRVSKKLPIKWRFRNDLPNEYRFVFQVKNVNNEVLLTKETIQSSLTLDIPKLDLPKGILLYSIEQQKKADNSGFVTEARSEFEIEFNDVNKSNHYLLTEFYLIIDALVADQKGMFELSNTLYSMSIEESNQDPRFIKLYEDFLERNPQFK